MRKPAIIALAFAGLVGCAAYKKETATLTTYPGIASQIEQYYNANATEDDWTCNEVQLDTIDKTKVARQTPNQVVIAVTYYFNSFDESLSHGGAQCQGFNTRFFTFDKGTGNQLSLVSMTGPQRGQNG